MNNKRYVCDICGKSFGRQNCKSLIRLNCNKILTTVGVIDLYRHAFVHKQIRPYLCDYCHKTFKKPKHWAEHRKRIHGISNKAYESRKIIKQMEESFLQRNPEA